MLQKFCGNDQSACCIVMHYCLSGKKHRNEFQFLVDQVNNRWKKSKRKTESAEIKEEQIVKELAAGTG